MPVAKPIHDDNVDCNVIHDDAAGTTSVQYTVHDANGDTALCQFEMSRKEAREQAIAMIRVEKPCGWDESFVVQVNADGRADVALQGLTADELRWAALVALKKADEMEGGNG
jgi:hypothetical protein